MCEKEGGSPRGRAQPPIRLHDARVGADRVQIESLPTVAAAVIGAHARERCSSGVDLPVGEVLGV